MRRVLIMTRDRRRSERLQELLSNMGSVNVIPAGPEPWASGNSSESDVVLVDASVLLEHEGTVPEAVEELSVRHSSAAVVVMGDSRETEISVEAAKAGAFDYLTHPVQEEELTLLLERVREVNVLHSELDYLRDQEWTEDFRSVVNTRSPRMRDVFEKVRQVANTRTTVLLTGETGTGKTMLARMIHAHSVRHDAAFIAMHCGAIPDTLVESEFFGYEKGAFTGATRRQLGKFELAHGGTIFLDEVSTVSQSTQIKLLDVIQSRTVQRLGGSGAIPVDVRIIAASNEDLGELCERGLFRRDLYYRLNVFPIHIPPLRDRKEDILRISEFLVRQFNAEFGKDVKTLHPHVVEAFMAYDWPGNVRELENVIERACILERSDILTPHVIPTEFFDRGHSLAASPNMDLPLGQARKLVVEKFEKKYLANLLKECGGVVKIAAAQAEITPRQLNKLMTRHGLVRKDFVPEKGIASGKKN